MTLKINSTEYEIRKLSANQTLECIKSSKTLYESLIVDNESTELASALAEYGALCCCCLYKDNKPAFKTPNEALACLSIDELCDVYDAYKIISDTSIENGFNENFSKEVCGEQL